MTDWSTDNTVIGLGAKVLTAPLSSTIPTYAGDTWDVAWVTMGAVSENGMTISPSRDVTSKKIWQSRANVLEVPNGQNLTIAHELVEWTNTTFGLWYGGGVWVEDATNSGNWSYDVSGDPDIDERMFGYEWTVTSGGSDYTWRLIIPRGMVTAIGDAKLVNNDWTAVNTTVTALKTSGVALATFQTDDPSVTPPA